MQQITVFHGSQKIIEKPIRGAGNPKNDYGSAFYCTESIELAKEWACSEKSDGFANRYELDISGLSVLSLNSGDYHILNWLAILLENRTFKVNTNIARQARSYILETFHVEYKAFDIIRGYRADDSYFSFANAFLNNMISLSQLEKAMMLGKLGEQIAIVSPSAFERLQFQEAITAPHEIYYPKKLARDSSARKEFAAEKGKALVLSEKYVLDVIREEWKNDDARIQRVILR